MGVAGCRDRGQGAVEYVGALAMAALVVGALALSGVGGDVATALERAACRVTGQDCRPEVAATTPPSGPAGGRGPLLAAPRLLMAGFGETGPCRLVLRGGLLVCEPTSAQPLPSLGEGCGILAQPGAPRACPAPDAGGRPLCRPSAAFNGSCEPVPLPTADPCRAGSPLSISASSFCPGGIPEGRDGPADPLPFGEPCTPFGPAAGFGGGTLGWCLGDPPGPIRDADAPWVGDARNQQPRDGAPLHEGDDTCELVCVEVLTGGRITEDELVDAIGTDPTARQIEQELNRREGGGWTLEAFRHIDDGEQIAQYARRWSPVGVSIFDPATGDTHMVVAIAMPGGNFRVVDPGYGTYEVGVRWLQRWGDAFLVHQP